MSQSIELPGKHPALYFVKYLILKDPEASDAQILKTMVDWGFLTPGGHFLGFVRSNLQPPEDFQPLNRSHFESTKFLRDEGVYDMFYSKPSVEEAFDILSDKQKRMAVEQILMSNMNLKVGLLKLNKKTGWDLSLPGVKSFGHFFWNVNLLTFDEWGRFLYGRTAMYERHMALLQGQQDLAFYHLRLEQVVDSKTMIQRAQQICYFTLEELAQKPGTSPDKVKGITVLTKGLVECHNALSTSDMALKDILQNFERFRMEHPMQMPPDIHQLSPGGQYTGSGVKDKEKDKN